MESITHIIAFLTTLASVGLTAFVIVRGHREPVDRAFFAFGLALSAHNCGFLASAFAQSPEQALAWAWAFHPGLVFLPPTFLHFVLTLIDEPRAHDHRWIMGAYTASVGLLAWSWLGRFFQGVTLVSGIYYPVVGGWVLAGLAADGVLIVGYAAWRLWRRIRTLAPGWERQRLKYLVWGLLLAAIFSIPDILLTTKQMTISPTSHIGTAFLVLLAAYSVIRQRDISIVIRKGLAYSVLTGALTAVFVLTILFSEHLFRQMLGYSSLLPAALAAILISIGFQPLRTWTQGVIDRRFFVDQLTRERALRGLTRELISMLDERQLLGSTLRTLQWVLHIKRGVILRGADGGGSFIIKAWSGEAPPDVSFSEKSALVRCLTELGREIERGRIGQDLRLGWMKDELWENMEILCAEICLPLWIKGRLLGILALGEKTSGEAYTHDDLDLLQSLSDNLSIALENAILYETTRSYLSHTMQALATAVEAKDSYTAGHCERVSAYAVALAKALRLPPDIREALRIGAHLHDIGKMGVDEAILKKPAQLTVEERKIIEQHPAIGTRIVEPLGFPKDVIDCIRHHHERFDGTGYPHRLQGTDIPLVGRIVAIADFYESLTSARAYRGALSDAEAIQLLKNAAGVHLDPELLQVFLKLVQNGIHQTIRDTTAPLPHPLPFD